MHDSKKLMPDNEIVELYFARDEQAIQATDDKYGKLCMQISMNIVESRSDAEECVNDTYLKTWNSIPPTRPNSLGAFVCRIARNLSLNRLRDLRAAKRNRELTTSLSELEACIPLPDEAAGRLPELLNDFLSRLDREERALFLGRYWYACSVKDLARKLGITPNAASMRLRRLRESLKAYLAEGGYYV